MHVGVNCGEWTIRLMLLLVEIWLEPELRDAGQCRLMQPMEHIHVPRGKKEQGLIIGYHQLA